jgi:DNA repair exonuclease SbcCD ATPase subunit
MILSLLYLVSALSISAIAAYFSVLGLATIFPGSMGPIIIMGGVLETGKIVAAIWLHRNWKTSPLLIKSYLTFAVLVLMGITSMGIFGFLSRAHIEHQTTTDKALAMVETINNKIKREQDYIERQKQYINSLENRTDKSTSSTRLDIDQENERIKDITEQMNKDILFEQGRINKLSEELVELNKELEKEESGQGGLFSNKKKKIEELKARQAPIRERINAGIRNYNESIDAFRAQAKKDTQLIIDKISNFRSETSEKGTTIQPQIDEHSKNIAESHGKIDDLEVEKMGLSDNARNLEAEVGPVKYVAEGIADITGKEFKVEQAVRIVIVILVLVFDPLAILLVIAANISISKHFPDKSPKLKAIELDEGKLEMAQSALEKKKEGIKSEEASLKNSLSKAKEEKARIEQDLLLAGAALKELNETADSHEAQIKSQEKIIKQKENDINIAEEALKEVVLKVESTEDDLSKKELKINTRKRRLEERESENIKAEASLDVMAATTEEREGDLKATIKILEETLKNLGDKKSAEKESLQALESKSENLESSIKTQRELISSLRNTYAEASKSSNLKDVFKTHGLAELVKIAGDGQKILSIKDSKDRVHQFIIPKDLAMLSHSYFHKTVESLNEVSDIDDLPHEYALEITKYIRGRRPQYNCLT